MTIATLLLLVACGSPPAEPAPAPAPPSAEVQAAPVDTDDLAPGEPRTVTVTVTEGDQVVTTQKGSEISLEMSMNQTASIAFSEGDFDEGVLRVAGSDAMRRLTIANRSKLKLVPEVTGSHQYALCKNKTMCGIGTASTVVTIGVVIFP